MIPFEVIALSPHMRELVAESARRRNARRFRDDERRWIEIDSFRTEDWSALLSMYGSLDPAQPVSNKPPLNTEQRAVWVDQLLSRGRSVVARSGQRIVGHAVLVADGDMQEIVMHVHRDHQRTGIESALSDALRGHSGQGRLRALGSAFRLVMIPVICALVIALVSENPRGVTIALTLAAGFVLFGLAVQSREILFARSLPRRFAPSDPSHAMGTRWMPSGGGAGMQ
jgi:hypothetical protein